MRRTTLLFCVLAAASAAGGCIGAETSADPLSPTVAGPLPGVTITAPALMLPSSGSTIPVAQQPITLTVGNAITTGVRPLTYTFEVATDVNFNNKVFSRSGVAPGSGSQTSLQLPSPLATALTYYWHAQALDGANTGNMSTVSSFTVFTPIVINAPALVSPVNNSTLSSPVPTFTFNDATRSGPVGPITYVIDVADSSTFTNMLAVWTLAEQPGQTSLVSPQPFPSGVPIFWQVRASDPTTVGPWSPVAVFQTPAAVVAPPPPSNSGGGGLFDHAWTGNVELELRSLLASGLAGANGLNGQAVIDQMNALGGIYAGAEFQPAHDGVGYPTYGFGWFYVTFVPLGNGTSQYQIVEFGTPPAGD